MGPLSGHVFLFGDNDYTTSTDTDFHFAIAPDQGCDISVSLFVGGCFFSDNKNWDTPNI